jgi:dihydroorotase
MASLLIRNGHVISPDDQLDGKMDIWIEDETIREVGPRLPAPVPDVIEAEGQVVCPGFVDLHVHLREPGGEVSETLETGLAAAVAGGFTSVCPMPNTRPVNDCAELTSAMLEKAKRVGLARVFPIAAVSVGSNGEQLTNFAALTKAGAVAFSDDGKPVKTAGLLRQALREASRLGVPIIDHCEDLSLSAGGAIHEGPVAARLGVKGIPACAEDVCVARDLVLAEESQAALHLAHTSTAGAIAMVREAKRRGVKVTCEVTPHHFTLTNEAVEQYGTLAKMNPPLRGAADVDALRAGIADGTIDAIATDHAPHAPQLKQKPLAEAPFGVIGLETALALALTQLVHPGRISLAQLVRLMSAHPARIISARAPHHLGRLRRGDPADVTVFDPNLEWTYRAAEGRSKSYNSPFDGWSLKGAVTATVVGGRLVYRRDR